MISGGCRESEVDGFVKHLASSVGMTGWLIMQLIFTTDLGRGATGAGVKHDMQVSAREAGGEWRNRASLGLI